MLESIVGLVCVQKPYWCISKILYVIDQFVFKICFRFDYGKAS